MEVTLESLTVENLGKYLHVLCYMSLLLKMIRKSHPPLKIQVKLVTFYSKICFIFWGTAI